MKKFFLLMIGLVVACFCTSCIETDLYEKHVIIPKYEWNDDFVPSFDFLVTDTLREHRVFLILKHHNDYDYQNIWLRIGFQPPKDSTHFFKTNMILADNEKGWLSSGLSDVYERRYLWQTIRFREVGTYHFRIEQIMRDNPLRHVIAVGVRIEQ